MKNTILIIVLMISNLGIAQRFTTGTATLQNNTVLAGKIRIDNNTSKVLVKNGSDIRSYNFSQINKVQIGKIAYNTITVDGTTYIASNLNELNSKASLYKIGGNEYLISVNEIYKNFNTKTEQHLIHGILSLIYNDCNEIRESIRKKELIKEKELVELTKQYNNCSYSYYAPTDKEIAEANKHNTDHATLYIGLGGNLNNVNFVNDGDTEGLSGGQLKIGVSGSPSFFGKIQNNLFAFLEASATFSKNKDFTNNNLPTSLSTNSYRFQFGLDYAFNKNGILKPFVGGSVGGHSDSFNGEIDTIPFDITGGNPITSIRLGTRFKLKNDSHIGVVLEYFTPYENDLTFRNEGAIIPLNVESENISIGVNYYF